MSGVVCGACVQLEICLRQLDDAASEAITVLKALELLARLSWNDDEVRELVAQVDGTPHHTPLLPYTAAAAAAAAADSRVSRGLPACLPACLPD